MTVSPVISLSPGPDPQREHDHSFVGGRPHLPPEEALPLCRLCGSEQAFFFQIAFPDDHDWRGTSVAVFACVSCTNEDRLIPEMLPEPLNGADIPEGFLDTCQENFRLLVFPTRSAIVREYTEKVRFRRLTLESGGEPAVAFGRLGGVPAWVQEEERPASYARQVAMTFLMQIQPECEFHTVPGAPRQVALGLDGKPTMTSRTHYELFLGNAVYLFGT
jgi:hypothetical protein